MKKMNTALSLLVAVLVFTGCMKDVDSSYYYASYGTYVALTGEDYQVNLDDGTTLIPISTEYISSEVEDGDRVAVVFGDYEVSAADESLIEAEVIQITELLTKDIIQLTTANQDSIGDDPVDLVTCWLTDEHINVSFYYWGYNTYISHYINLVKPIKNPIDSLGRQILELRQNENGDYRYYEYTGVACFRVDSILEEGQDTVVFVIKTTDYDGEAQEWVDTFVVNNNIKKLQLPVFEADYLQQLY